MFGVVLGYLVLRELPIRRFYARAVIMAYAYYRLRFFYRFRIGSNS